MKQMMSSRWVLALASFVPSVAVALLSLGCADAETVFIGTRLENLCVQSVPGCIDARCAVTADQYIRSTFPGGETLVVRSDTDDAVIRVRSFLIDQAYPGTEFQVRAYDTGCRDSTERVFADRDLFLLAGDDSVIEVELEVQGRGDHVIEIYSDMASNYLLTVEVIEEL